VAYRIYVQPSSRIMYHRPLKPGCSSFCPVCPESIQHFVLISKNRAVELYIGMGCMSNQQKAEFVSGIFHIQSFWGGHGKISPNS
jgi:hypothetical protein